MQEELDRWPARLEPVLDEATLTYGKRVAEALLGLDALYRSESEDGDGLVVLNMDTAGDLVAGLPLIV